LCIKGAQRRLDSVAETSNTLFDSWTHESTAEDDVSQPDSGDALCNSVPSLPSPPAFDRQHGARSKSQWRFSFNIQNVRLREVGRAILEKGVRRTIGRD
jgi:hypothetical protein